jgi:hypothetical protein
VREPLQVVVVENGVVEEVDDDVLEDVDDELEE